MFWTVLDIELRPRQYHHPHHRRSVRHQPGGAALVWAGPTAQQADGDALNLPLSKGAGIVSHLFYSLAKTTTNRLAGRLSGAGWRTAGRERTGDTSALHPLSPDQSSSLRGIALSSHLINKVQTCSYLCLFCSRDPGAILAELRRRNISVGPVSPVCTVEITGVFSHLCPPLKAQ